MKATKYIISYGAGYLNLTPCHDSLKTADIIGTSLAHAFTLSEDFAPVPGALYWPNEAELQVSALNAHLAKISG